MTSLFPTNEELQVMMQEIFDLHHNERHALLASIDLLGRLHQGHAEARLRLSPGDFAQTIGLTVDKYFKRLQVHKTMRIFPQMRQLLESGAITFSQIVAMGPHLTQANVEVMLEGVRGKTKREALAYIARVTASGEVLPKVNVVELRLHLSRKQLEILERVREVLAAGGKIPTMEQVVLAAAEDLLKHKDPLRKAQRAEARRLAAVVPKPKDLIPPSRTWDQGAPAELVPEPADLSKGEGKEVPAKKSERLALSTALRRSHIGARLRHQVWFRDQGQCTWCDGQGDRCDQRMMLELDHINLWCRGGENEVSNLRLRCRHHNQVTAAMDLGRSPYQMQKPEMAWQP